MNDRTRLVLLSFLMLFVELFIIRWLGSSVVYLSYFSNFVLLGSFLGIGIGFLRARASRDLFPWSPVALTLLVVFLFLFPVEIDRSGSQVIYFGTFTRTGLPMWITLPVIFVSSAAIMAMVAEGVARIFVKFPPLEAYRLDIIGALGGIAAFSGLSFLGAPPVVWGLVIALGFMAVLPRVAYLQGIALFGLVAPLAVQSLNPYEKWSPYYRVSAELLAPAPDSVIDIKVNGIPHQLVQSLERRRLTEPFYFIPYERISSRSLERVLVVGAGTGTDVAIALAHGARHVDAVEIDPLLYRVGKQFHPDRPYDDPRVEVHIDDARAFLERTDNAYDLILFALPDSLTLVPGQASVRLESYLFTTEAIEEARDHLAPSGVFTMYNYYREPWLIDRLANTLQQAFGNRPCLDASGGTARLGVLTAARSPAAMNCPSYWSASSDTPPEPVTDGHPFPYVKGGIPATYLMTILLILIASLVAVRAASGPLGPVRRYADLFFMGAAFLLLETKSVVQFALLFGTTWFVNALVFGGILLSVYLAVEVARRSKPKRMGPLYVLLFGSLTLAWLVSPHQLLALSPPVRFLAAVSLAFIPIFVANLVFAERFRQAESPTTAFGANLLGAMVGGLLEYSALLIGYRHIALVVGALYAISFLLHHRHSTAAVRVPALGRRLLTRSA